MADAINIIINGVDNASGALGRVSDSLTNMGSKLTSIGGSLTAATAPLAIMGAVGIKTAGDFESSMNVLSIAARSSGTSLEDLSAAALAVGGDVTLVGVSASQAGASMTDMYKAGLTTNQIFGDMQGYLAGTTPLTGALRAAIDLAAASELDLAQATTAVGVTMNQFGLDASQASNVANVLVQTADAGVASVAGLADSLGNVGPVAAGMGMSLDDTTLALGLMAQAGITGAEAGTNLKSMLVNLTSQTSETTGTLNALGVSLYDAQGNMLPLPNIIGQLETSMAGMTQEQQNATIATLAGSYGMNAMRTLLAEGSVGWNEMATAIGSAATVQESAAARTQGFNAALETLKGVIETLMITALTPLIHQLTPLVQRFGEVASKVMEADPSLVALAVTLGALAVAAGPVLMMLGVMVTALGALLSPIGLVVVAVAALAAAFATGAISIDSVRPILDGVGEAFNTLRDVAETVLTSIQTFWATHGATILASAQSTWNAIQTVVSGVVNAISAVIRAVFGVVQTFLEAHGEEIQNFVVSAWTQIQVIIQTVLAIIQATVIPVLRGVAQFIEEHSEEIQSLLYAAWTAIKTVIDVTLTFIEGIVKAVLQVIKGDWEGAWETLLETARSIWDTIKSAIQIIAEKIGPVLAAIWEEIKATAAQKWEEVKQAIAQKLFETLEKINTWLLDTFKKISTFDLKAAAVTAFKTVLSGVIEKAAEILEAVGTFLKDIGEKIQTRTFKSATMTAIATVVGGILAKVGEILETVGGFLTDIWNKISEFSLFDAGVNLIQGMVNGIRSMVGSLVAAAQGVVNDAIQAAKNLLGMHSPSRVFYDIGIGMMQGAALGVWAAADEIVDAIAETFSQVTAEATEGAVNVAEAVNAIIGVLRTLARFQFDPGVLIGRMEDFTEAVHLVIGKLKELAEFFADPGSGLDSAKAVMDALKPVFEGISAAMEALQSVLAAVLTWTGTELPDGIQTILDNIIAFVRQIVDSVAAMAEGLTDEGVAAAKLFAEAAEASIGWIASAVDAFMKLKDYDASFSLIEAGMWKLKRQIGNMVEWLVAASQDFDLNGLDAALAFSEAASAAVSWIGEAVDAFMKLKEYDVNFSLFEAGMWKLKQQVGNMVEWLVAAAANFEIEGLQAAQLFGETISAAVGWIGDAVDAFNKFREYDQTFSLAENGMAKLKAQVVNMVQWLVESASHFDTAGLQAAMLFAEAVSAVSQAITDAISGIAALMEYSGELALLTVVQFLQDMMLMVQTFATAAAHFSQFGLAEAVAFAEAAGTIGSSIGDAIAGIQALMQYAGGLAVSTVVLFLQDMQLMVRTFENAADSFSATGLAAATTFAEAAGTIGSSIEDAISGIYALMGYTGGLAVLSAVLFLQDLQLMVRIFENAADDFSAIGLAAATAFAQAVGTIGGAIEDAINGIYALLTYTGGLAVYGMVLFLQDLQLMVRTFENAADSFSATGLAAATAFAEAAGTIGSSIEAAINGINALLTYTGGLAVLTVVLFLQDMQLMVRTFENAADSFSATGLTAATAFAQAAGTIGGSIKNAIEGINALLTYTGGLAVLAVVKFLQDLQLMVRTFENAADDFSTTGLAAATVFAQSAGTIGGSISDAITGIKALMEYVGGLGVSAVVKFLQDLQLMVRAFENAADSFSTTGLAAATAFAEAAGTIGSSIEDAINGIGAMLTYTGGLALATVVAFLQDMQLMVRTFENGADDFTSEGLAAATAFAEALGTIGGSIDDAVKGIGALLDYAGGVADTAIDAFIADMLLVVHKMETAAAQFSAEGLKAAAAFASAAGDIGKGIGDAVAGLGALADYSGTARASIDLFLADMHYVVQKIVEAAAAFTAEGLAQAQLYAQTAADIGDALVAGYESLVGENGIYGYVGIAHDTIDLFLADMIYVVEKVVEAAAAFTGPGLAGANTLSATMKAVGNAIEAGVGGLIKPQGGEKNAVTLSDYAGIAHDIFDLFLADMVYVVGIVEQAAIQFTDKGLVQAQRFADAGGKIFSAIEDGVKAAAAVAKLPAGVGVADAMRLITQSVTDAVTAIAAKFSVLVTAAYNFGYGWVDGIINGINARLGDLEALLEYIRGLFPSSPAKYGPWRTLPDGQSVGAGFTGKMAQGLWSGGGGVAAALTDLRDAFGLTAGYAGGFGGGLQPAMAAANSAPLTININNPSVRSDRDIEAMAAAVSDILARQAVTNSRLARI